jgi:hypothetical protein
MKGRNALELNAATVMLAIEEYYSRRWCGPLPFVIASIRPVRDGGCDVFRIELDEKQGEAAPTATGSQESES